MPALGWGLAPALAALTLACQEPPTRHSIVPRPQSVRLVPGDSAIVWIPTRIVVDAGDPALVSIASQLAGLIGNWARTTPRVVEPGQPETPEWMPSQERVADTLAVDIRLTTQGADADLGPEGYELEVTGEGVTVRAPTHAGVFYGVQTLRQLLPAEVEYTAAYPRPWVVPGIVVRDRPRYAWRGAMLDVSRHFRTVDEVKRFIDLIAPYKLNRLHLHLSDDQGWRVDVPGWPDLARVGGSTEVGGGPGGYYTMSEYEEIVAYGAERFVMVVPEIDVPGHVNAALASYPDLNCDGVAPELFTGTRVGFSALCFELDSTYAFLEDVVRELSARTPGPFFHMGGDEVPESASEGYDAFVARMSTIVASNGKQMIGWDEIATVDLVAPVVIQLWRPFWSDDRPLEGERAERASRMRAGVQRAIERGATVILSPADRLYLDMKYDSATVIGLSWAGLTDERRAYDWRVRDLFGLIPEDAILGVEAPLWSETLGTMEDVEYMGFPRLAAVAELGWTQEGARDWESFRRRLAAQGPRWSAQGVNFRRSPGIDWVP